MAWAIEFAREAQRDLAKLDHPIAQRVLRFLNDRIRPLEDPRSVGEALKGDRLGAFWKYRVGDIRIIASIEDKRLLITVVRVGNRREVYR